MCTSSKAVLERLKAVSIAAATSVEEHVASSDLVIEIPFVLSTPNVKLFIIIIIIYLFICSSTHITYNQTRVGVGQ